MLSMLLLVLLVILLLGALPAWPYSRSWGYYPSGGLGIVLVIILILADGSLLRRLAFRSVGTPALDTAGGNAHKDRLLYFSRRGSDAMRLRSCWLNPRNDSSLETSLTGGDSRSFA